jgi:malate synthase
LTTTLEGVEVVAPADEEVLSADALTCVAELQRELGSRRHELLEARRERHAALLRGERPEIVAREGDWRVAEAPPDLRDRRVEITGAVDRKMVINALNSGARVFMADFEDANSHAELGERANQVERLREDVSVSAEDLLDFAVPGGDVTEAGLAQNVSVGVRYLAAWLSGTGAAALDNLMEDAATAEISRSQVWQWVRAGRFTRERVLEELEPWRGEHPEAAELFEEVALSDALVEFLTLPAYQRLE